MIRKFFNHLNSRSRVVEPRQGKRLERDQNGKEVVFTIRGKGRPGFFILFGCIFGGIPGLMLFAMLFGTTTSEGGPMALVLVFLLLSSFTLVGAASVFVGVFLWFGKTRVVVLDDFISVTRKLFGRCVQRREFAREGLQVTFKKSHEENDRPSYELMLESPGSRKIGLGGSLKEEELLWLERELRTELGDEAKVHGSVQEAISESEIEGLMETEVDCAYRSKAFVFEETIRGWVVRSKGHGFAAVFLILFGLTFILIGMLMAEESRRMLFERVPLIAQIANGMEFSGGDPPWFFPFVFGGLGFLTFLCGLFVLFYRVWIYEDYQRVGIERRWLMFSRQTAIEGGDIDWVGAEHSGEMNGQPTFKVFARLMDGREVVILRWANAEDAGQIRARIDRMR